MGDSAEIPWKLGRKMSTSTAAVVVCEASVTISGRSSAVKTQTRQFLFFIFSLLSAELTLPPNSQQPTVASKVKANVVFLLFDHISHSFTNTTLIQTHPSLSPTPTNHPFLFSPPAYHPISVSQATRLSSPAP